ncbi:DsrH/TusB family sulfur relay protein [Vespertiliibacter pulmonis]|uniref:DsrH/TusB family sulfur relay protein n=1 Tax=Vespertiliibacter pulmonis TaxID=1443036 RepID=UPI000F52111A|nr:DsrH/TusB family sulfur metabolism protein [Vespertiliibacter pulmonis]
MYLSQANYTPNELTQLLHQITDNDALVLWQNGVLQAVKFPNLFANISNVFVLENDIKARGLTVPFKTITLSEFISISEKFFPQVAL